MSLTPGVRRSFCRPRWHRFRAGRARLLRRRNNVPLAVPAFDHGGDHPSRSTTVIAQASQREPTRRHSTSTQGPRQCDVPAVEPDMSHGTRHRPLAMLPPLAHKASLMERSFDYTVARHSRAVLASQTRKSCVTALHRAAARCHFACSRTYSRTAPPPTDQPRKSSQRRRGRLKASVIAAEANSSPEAAAAATAN